MMEVYGDTSCSILAQVAGWKQISVVSLVPTAVLGFRETCVLRGVVMQLLRASVPSVVFSSRKVVSRPGCSRLGCVRAPSSQRSHTTAAVVHTVRDAEGLNSQPSRGGPAQALFLALIAGTGIALAGPAAAFELHAEPANALSLPTWAIHVSSVAEWAIAIGLMWQFAEASGNERWKGMSWGMLPCLGSAMCACTWHFYYNSPDLEFLVALQAFLTVVGNCTCWIAAYRIYKGAQEASQ
jgi:hypothetical protein